MFSKLLYSLINLFGENFNDIIIILTALLTAYWYVNYDLIELSGIKKSLKGLNANISELKGYDADNIKKLDERFYTRMDGGLKNAWEACLNDFRHVMNKEKIPDIKEYFNIHNIITVPASRKRAEAIPGIVSMVGILGTFLSILSELSRLNFSLPQGDENSFLNIMASSFSILIVAFILSLLFMALDRKMYLSTITELNSFQRNVSMKIPMASEYGGIELLIKEQRSQNEAIANMGIDISGQLGQFINKELVPTVYRSFDTAINKQIGPSIKALSDMLLEISEETRNIQTKGMQEMTDSFAVKLESTMGLEFGKLGEKYIEELNNQREVLRQESKEYFEKMDEQIYKIIDDLNIQLEAAFTRFNDITEMAFERMDSSLNSSVEGISNHLKSLADQMDDQVRDISIYAKGLSEEVAELNDRLENSVKEFGSQVNETVNKTVNSFDDGLSEICGRLDRTVSDIKETVDEFPAIVETLKFDCTAQSRETTFICK